MKKAIGSSIILVVFLSVIALTAVQTAGSTSFYHLGEENAQFLGGEGSEQTIFEIEGIAVTKGEVQTEVQSRMDQGMGKEEAVEQTLDFLIQKKAIYACAKEAGYTVSDEEFADYQTQLRDSASNAENREDLEAYYDGFGGEDAYWETMEPVIRENLVIRSYLEEQSAELLESQSTVKTSAEAEEELKDQIFRNAYNNVDVKELESVIRSL